MIDENRKLDQVQQLNQEFVTEVDTMVSLKDLPQQVIDYINLIFKYKKQRKQNTVEEQKDQSFRKSSTKEDDITFVRNQLTETQKEFADYKLQTIQEIKQLKQQLENRELSNELETLKSSLITYWRRITQNLNEEFEEILSLGMGAESDVSDIINSLFFLQEASEQSRENDQQKIAELSKKVSDLENERSQVKNVEEYQGNEKFSQRELQILWKEVEEVKKWKEEQMLNKNANDYKIQQEQIKQLEQKIQSQNADILQQKQLHIEQMSNQQNEITNLKQQILELKAKLQETEFERDRLKIQIEKIIEQPRSEQGVKIPHLQPSQSVKSLQHSPFVRENNLKEKGVNNSNPQGNDNFTMVRSDYLQRRYQLQQTIFKRVENQFILNRPGSQAKIQAISKFSNALEKVQGSHIAIPPSKFIQK